MKSTLLRKCSQAIIFVFAVSLLGFYGCSDDDEKTTEPVTYDLLAGSTSTAPTVDGTVDAIWSSAESILLKCGEDASFASEFGVVDVTMKALNDGENIYFLITWEDPSGTENVDKNQWTFDGSDWSKDGNEDRFFMMFDGNTNGSEGADCSSMCHGEAMATTGGGNVDVWHWKAARTNPVGLADDKWWDGDGRGNDTKDIGSHYDNINAEEDAPMYSGPITADGHFIIIGAGQTADDLTPFDPETDVGPIPGYYLNENADGSRNDVSAGGVYSNGTWTLELSGKLNTGNTDDFAFAVGSEIQISCAVTDNSGGSHSGVAPFIIKIQ